MSFPLGWVIKLRIISSPVVHSRKKPYVGGGIFIFISLILNQEKAPPLVTRFHWLYDDYAAKTKSKAWAFQKPQGMGFFTSLAKIEKNKP